MRRGQASNACDGGGVRMSGCAGASAGWTCIFERESVRERAYMHVHVCLTLPTARVRL